MLAGPTGYRVNRAISRALTIRRYPQGRFCVGVFR